MPVVQLSAPPSAREEDADGASEASSAPGLAFTVHTRTAHITELRWLALDAHMLLVGDGSGCVRMWEATPTAAATIGPDEVTDDEPGTAKDVYPTADRIKVSRLTVCPLREGGSERLVVIVKGNFIVVVLLDATGHIIATALQYFKHVAITGE